VAGTPWKFYILHFVYLVAAVGHNKSSAASGCKIYIAGLKSQQNIVNTQTIPTHP